MARRMNIKRVNVNFDNRKSIKSAEKKKMILENKGFNLKKTQQTGLNKFVLIYKIKESRKK